ncbi:MAG: sigma-70 family RNA polymerase sigma factor [Planctomycetota bacterium]
MKAGSSAGDAANPGSTDDGLLEGLRARDEKAWGQFVELYSPLIYVWCRKCDLQSADARDVSQQVLHAVNRSIDSFRRKDASSSFRGWLFTITRNSVRNYLSRTLRGPRARGGTSIQIQLLDQPEAVDEESLSTTLHPTTTSIQGILDSARNEFDDQTWQCFWLVVMEGLSAVDVAKRLKMNPAAVRQAKYRVTKRLRSDLEDFS